LKTGPSFFLLCFSKKFLLRMNYAENPEGEGPGKELMDAEQVTKRLRRSSSMVVAMTCRNAYD